VARHTGSVPRPLLTGSIAFLEWLEHDNFTFLGMRELELSGDAETGNLGPSRRELGVLRVRRCRCCGAAANWWR
jgi:NAD-specific glutamate dehydrogenase